MEFVAIEDVSLDWKDCGRKVELVSKDGTVVCGELDCDVGFSGEDEYPIFEVVMPDRSTRSVWDFEKMRYLDE